MKIHPHDELLAEFAATLSQGEGSLVDHLAECCRCRGRLLALIDRSRGPLPERLAEVLPWPEPPDVDYGPAIAAAERSLLTHSRALAAERAEAPGSLVELETHPPERREMLMRNHPRFQTWGLLECLIERVRERTFESPRAALDLARLGLALAECLDAGYYGAERIEDLRGRTWGFIANARRVASDLAGAEEAFETATGHLRMGTGDPLERALFLDLRASLRRDQRRLDTAKHLLLRALRLYEDVGETHRAGRILISLSTLHEHGGTPERAIPLLQEALTRIDAGREPRLLLSAQHNLITNLAEAGRFMEAHGLFIQARPLYASFPDAWTQSRRHWVAGKIARGLGQAREAEAHLLAARGGFAVEKAVFDTALVSLDLASLYAAQGRTAELKEVAGEVLAIFAAGQVHREALAALSYLRQAAEAERASLEVVASVGAYLKRLRHEPGLPFQVP
jgi:tetratricopeptide (TPR) repeat protein